MDDAGHFPVLRDEVVRLLAPSGEALLRAMLASGLRTLELEFPLPSFLKYYDSKPTELLGNLIGLGFQGAAPWIIAAAVGIPTFLLVVVTPLAFLGGLREVFRSNVWTLTYRELLALEQSYRREEQ